jgi:hypothetical protein
MKRGGEDARSGSVGKVRGRDLLEVDTNDARAEWIPGSRKTPVASTNFVPLSAMQAGQVGSLGRSRVESGPRSASKPFRSVRSEAVWSFRDFWQQEAWQPEWAVADRVESFELPGWLSAAGTGRSGTNRQRHMPGGMSNDGATRNSTIVRITNANPLPDAA